MAATPPVDPWAATAVLTDVAQPPTQLQNSGWKVEDIPTHQHFNYLFRHRTPHFGRLEDAAAQLVPGQMGVVDEALYGQPGTIESEAGTTALLAVACTGREVITSDGVTAKRFDRSDLSTVLTTYTPTNAGSIADIATNGTTVVLAYGNFVEAYDLAGVSLWVHNQTAIVRGIAVSNDVVLVVGDADGTGHEAVGLNLTSTPGSIKWQYNHNGDLFSCATNGLQAFIAGAASGHASLATHRSIDLQTGNDAANEGGTAALGQDWAWDRAGNPVTLLNALAIDEKYLYSLDDPGAGMTLARRPIGEGGAGINVVLPTGAQADAIAVDQDYVYVSYALAAPGSYLKAFSKVDLGRIWTNPRQTATMPRCKVAIDGGAVWVATTDLSGSAGQKALARYGKGRGAFMVRRLDQDAGKDVFTPWPMQIYPHR